MLGSAASIASRLEPVASGERTVELVRAESPDPAVRLTAALHVRCQRSGTAGQQTTARTSLCETNFAQVLDGRAVVKSRL